MRALAAAWRVVTLPARLVIRAWRWITPSPEQRIRSTQLRKQARQQAYDAVRQHYTRGGVGPGFR